MNKIILSDKPFIKNVEHTSMTLTDNFSSLISLSFNERQFQTINPIFIRHAKTELSKKFRELRNDSNFIIVFNFKEKFELNHDILLNFETMKLLFKEQINVSFNCLTDIDFFDYLQQNSHDNGYIWKVNWIKIKIN